MHSHVFQLRPPESLHPSHNTSFFIGYSVRVGESLRPYPDNTGGHASTLSSLSQRPNRSIIPSRSMHVECV